MLAPQTQWLQGTSTNFGDDTAADPDYVFERAKNPTLSAPQDGGLSISTPGFVTGVQPLTVSSRDFGGAAQLRGIATLENLLTVDVDIVDTTQGGAPVAIPSGACGASYRVHPFASLPVDQDCDGMADGWEAFYGGITPSADGDQAANGGSTVGDGLIALDEYRGFHYIERSSGSPVVSWTSTDPVRKLDLFFWDADGLFSGDLAFFRNQFPFIILREVDGRMGIQRSRRGSVDVVSRINPNSTSRREVFPLLLVNGILGDCTPVGGRFNAILGHAPDEPPARGPDGRAIQLDDVNLNRCAAFFNFPQSDWRQVLSICKIISVAL